MKIKYAKKAVKYIESLDKPTKQRIKRRDDNMTEGQLERRYDILQSLMRDKRCIQTINYAIMKRKKGGHIR